MKFSCCVTIHQSKDKVARYFADPSLLHHFQDGFKSKTLISGVEGKNGAKSKMVYEKLELLETIIENNLPDEFYALYEHKYMTNTMRVKFKTLEEGSTQYFSEIDYTKLKGFMITIMARLFPGMFRKQVLKWMNQFKTYCENN